MADPKTPPRKYAYSTPSFPGLLHLNSEQAKRFGGTEFDNVTSALFVIDVMARKLARRRKNFNHQVVADAVSKTIEKMQTEVNNEIQRMETFLKKEGISQRPNYSNPLERKFNISSPEVMRLTHLLQAFDTLISLIDTAWLAQKLDSDEASDFRERKTNDMSKMVKALIKHGAAARAMAYANNEVEVQKDIEKVEAQVAADKQEREAAGFVEPAAVGEDVAEVVEAAESAA
ncbi:DUF1845 domain-containing protein [Azotobacter salinestris]|uniref:DUF1845 domain-containing protein n=1 Tax=Azotobacter salinestris TaxID=69964 RepID=UPI001266D6D1|nr:DUF1845 domain-containing protein [Azotobacter salinestris]